MRSTAVLRRLAGGLVHQLLSSPSPPAARARGRARAACRPHGVTVVTLKIRFGRPAARASGTGERAPGGRSAPAGQRHRQARSCSPKAAWSRPARSCTCWTTRCIAPPSAAPRRRACSAQAALESAKSSADRGAELVKTKMISVQDNDNLQSAYHQAQADLAAAEAAADAARINLAYAHISAPITGRIGKSAVTQGALVVANQPDALATGAAARHGLRRRDAVERRVAAAPAGTVGRRPGGRERARCASSWRTAAPILRPASCSSPT